MKFSLLGRDESRPYNFTLRPVILSQAKNLFPCFSGHGKLTRTRFFRFPMRHALRDVSNNANTFNITRG
jgi:hypothetical protein